ncbi:hypothetical protein TURU_070614 [Turdus rufiventris]|nr:hypothetical protein TURU_070614 [Turdus rufiventris]
MTPFKVVIRFALNSLTTAWIVPQPCQNICVTLVQTVQQEDMCLSTAAARDPMSTCLVGIPFQAGQYPASFDTHIPNLAPKSHSIRPHQHHHRQTIMMKNP